jgi:hypothetical protein
MPYAAAALASAWTSGRLLGPQLDEIRYAASASAYEEACWSRHATRSESTRGRRQLARDRPCAAPAIVEEQHSCAVWRNPSASSGR